MKTNDEKSIFFKTLKETPFISYAAKKTGIARSTIYRWIKDGLGFRELVDEAIKEGRKQFNDIAEMALLKKIKDGDMRAIIFYLERNDKQYFPKRTSYEPPMKKLEPGDICPACGYEEIEQHLTGDELKESVRSFAEDMGLLPGPLSGFVAENIEEEEDKERERLIKEHEDKKRQEDPTL